MIWKLIHRFWFRWLPVWWAIVDYFKGKPIELVMEYRFKAGDVLIDSHSRAWKVIRNPREEKTKLPGRESINSGGVIVVSSPGERTMWRHQVRPHKQFKKQEEQHGKRDYSTTKHDPGC